MLPLGALLFFLSGFAALLYQVVWQRLLAIFSGADLHSITIIVAAFMGGLGFGSLVGGRLADRMSVRGAAFAFGGAELAIGLFGLMSATFYYDVLYMRFGDLAASAALMPAVLFFSLLWPTFFMGASLPLLARALTTSVGAAPRTIGLLYGFNTFGAAIGALATTWWLIPRMGLSGSLQVSGALNILVAVASLLLARLATNAKRAEIQQEASRAPSAPAGVEMAIGVPGWSAIYALSGLVALSLEIVWFRMLGVLIKATAFTFGTLLFVYLTGLAIGAVAGSVLARHVRRPAYTFLLLQSMIGIYAGASFAAFLAGLPDASSLAWLRQYLGGYEPLDFATAVQKGGTEFTWLYFGIPAAVILPPTLLMGASFPLLQKVVQTDLARLGSRTGTLLLANIVGSTLGTLLTGWLTLGVLGTAITLKLIVAASGIFSIIAVSLHRDRRSRPVWITSVGAALVVAVVVFSMPPADLLWARLHSARPRWIVAGEDGTGVSVLVPPPGITGRTAVFVNGIGQSWIPYGDIHTILGALPAFLHPAPQSAAVIGLGSGDTVFAVAGRSEVRRITCIEIVGAQRQTLLELSERNQYPGLRTVLFDPRIEHVTGDGRLHLKSAGHLYDIIEADALRPGSAYSGNLYSDQYFALLLSRLRPGGLAVTWSPTPRIQRTFVKVFPHVVSYGHLLVGSNQAIVVDAAAIRSRLGSQAVRDYYFSSGIDIERLLEPYLRTAPEVFGPEYDRSGLDDINTDLFPRDEFSLPPVVEWRALFGASGR